MAPGSASSRVSGLALRPAGPGDDAFLRLVYAGTREDELKLVDWTEEQKQAFLTMQFDAQDSHYRKHYPDTQYLVIELQHQPVGRLYLHRTPEEIHIIDIALLPVVRNRGIGSAILTDILAESAQTSRPVRIHVEQFNPALRLYLRLGFQMKSEAGLYFLMERPPDTAGLTQKPPRDASRDP